MAIYKLRQNYIRRVVPYPADFGVVHNPNQATEGYYIEYDVRIPLLPEGRLQPEITSNYRFIANPGFVRGEILTGAAALDIQELDFTGALPNPGFVRGEVITDAATGTTATIGRRYSDDRYLVYDVTGLWGAGPVTGALGGGALVAGVVNTMERVRCRFDSVHWKDNTVNVVYDQHGLFPPGSTIVGNTSGITAIPLECMHPKMTAEFWHFMSQCDTAESPTGVMFKSTLLWGDFAQLLNDLGAAADYGQRRAQRGELFWDANLIHGVSDSPSTTCFYLAGIQFLGNWGSTIPNPALATTIPAPEFKDGIVWRLYISAQKAAAVLTEPIFTRQITYNEYWDYQSVQLINGQ